MHLIVSGNKAVQQKSPPNAEQIAALKAEVLQIFRASGSSYEQLNDQGRWILVEECLTSK